MLRIKLFIILESLRIITGSCVFWYVRKTFRNICLLNFNIRNSLLPISMYRMSTKFNLSFIYHKSIIYERHKFIFLSWSISKRELYELINYSNTWLFILCVYDVNAYVFPRSFLFNKCQVYNNVLMSRINNVNDG